MSEGLTAELRMRPGAAAQELAEHVRAALAEIGVTVNLCAGGDGPFDLEPDFFGTNARNRRGLSYMIR